MFNIGSSLREARTRQNLGFEEMELRTKVRARYLRHLEDADVPSVVAAGRGVRDGRLRSRRPGLAP